MRHETTQHYDQEVELFQRFLDPYMKYTSGLFVSENDDDFDAAAVRMLDKVIDLAALPEGEGAESPRVLEIGNGWGSLLKRLSERRAGRVGRADADGAGALGFRYTGVNPAAVQQAYVARNVSSAAELVVASCEDAMERLDGAFDAVFMLGCLCHVKEKERVLAHVARLLAPRGRLVLEDTFFLSEELYQKHRDRPETRFVQSEIFGYAHVHSLGRHWDMARGAGLRVMSTLDISDHYRRTISVWSARLAALEPARFPTAPAFVQYLDLFQRGWGYTIAEHLMVLEKLPISR